VVADRFSLPMRLISMVLKGPVELSQTERICAATRDIVGADGASVTIDNTAQHRVTLCATDERSSELDNLQDVLGEGPCRDAFSSQLPVSTGVDRWAVSRWPAFIPAAGRVVGPEGVLWSLPMHADSKVLGTLNLYRLSGAALTEPIDAVQVLADAVAAMLITNPAADSQYAVADRWAARAVVHQATGILMAQLSLGPDDAMAVLRAHAFTAAARLAQVAQNIIDGGLDLSDR
jgi:hypothetical protein